MEAIICCDGFISYEQWLGLIAFVFGLILLLSSMEDDDVTFAIVGMLLMGVWVYTALGLL